MRSTFASSRTLRHRCCVTGLCVQPNSIVPTRCQRPCARCAKPHSEARWYRRCVPACASNRRSRRCCVRYSGRVVRCRLRPWRGEAHRLVSVCESNAASLGQASPVVLRSLCFLVAWFGASDYLRHFANKEHATLGVKGKGIAICYADSLTLGWASPL